MLGWLSEIGGIILAFAQFFIQLIETIFLSVKFLLNAVELPIVLIGFLPSVIAAPMLIILALLVVKFIIGR